MCVEQEEHSRRLDLAKDLKLSLAGLSNVFCRPAWNQIRRRVFLIDSSVFFLCSQCQVQLTAPTPESGIPLSLDTHVSALDIFQKKKKDLIHDATKQLQSRLKLE